MTAQLYGLGDGREAYAAEITARTVQLTKRGRVIGDRTMGAVMQAESRGLSLGIETRMFYGVEVTDADIVMADGTRLEKVGVVPDELLLPTGEDLAAGRDVSLARALTLAGVPTDPAKAGSIYAKANR